MSLQADKRSRTSNAGWFTTTKKLFDVITDTFGWIGNISAILVMLIFLVDVSGRAIFNKPLYASNEMVELVMVVLGLSIMYATRADCHVKVDILVPKFKPLAQRITRKAGQGLTFITTGVIAVEIIRNAIDQIAGHQTAVLLGIPVGYFSLLFALSMFWSTMISLVQVTLPGLLKDESVEVPLQ